MGNVVIGTTAPGAKLDVDNSAAASTAAISLNSQTGQNSQLLMKINGTLKSAFTSVASDTSLRINHNGSDRLTIAASGNVGIGTTAPTAALDIGTGSIGMGYEQVVATCPSAGACGVSCSAGKQVLGGGCDLATNAVLQTKPNSTTGWTCTATGTTYMNVWAICARMK